MDCTNAGTEPMNVTMKAPRELAIVFLLASCACACNGEREGPTAPGGPESLAGDENEEHLLAAGEALFHDEELEYITDTGTVAVEDDGTFRFSTRLCNYVPYEGPLVVATVESGRYLVPEGSPWCDLDYASRPSEFVLKVEGNAAGPPVPLSLKTVYVNGSPWMFQGPGVGQRVLVALREDDGELFWMDWIPLAVSTDPKETGVHEGARTVEAQGNATDLPTNFAALSRAVREARAERRCGDADVCKDYGWPACVRDPAAYREECQEGYVAPDAGGYPPR